MIESEIEEREVMPSSKTLGSLNGDLVSRLEALIDLVNELEPKLKGLTAEVGPTVNRIKANIDKDETLILVERLTANMGNLNEMVSLMEALNDMRIELEPKFKALAAEVSPTVNAMKANIDKDETLILVQRLTSNMGTFNEMLSLMEALNDMRVELEPKFKALAAEVSPTVNAIKANIDKDETLVMVQRLTANMGTFNEMLSLLEAFNDLRVELEPKLKGLMAEVSPTINALRAFVDNEKTWNLTKNLANTAKDFVEGDDIQVLLEQVPSLMGLMVTLTQMASAPTAQKLVAATATAMQETKDTDIKAITPLGLFSALRDPDIQRATGFLVHFLKKLGQGLK